MTDAEDFEHGTDEPGAIGVGMGGSCPVCRAPVDLGQEFCLECGSPIRFTPRQRRQQKGRPADGARGAAPAAPPRTGFPWVPFLIVLALFGGGVAFALMGGGDEKASNKSTTESALPSITNEVPETTTGTETETVDDCATAGVDATQPALGDAGTSAAPTIDPSTGAPTASGTEEIPQLSDGSAIDGDVPGFEDPSVPPTDGSSETVTVDRNGNLCPDTATEDPNAIPATTDASTTTPGGTTTTGTTATGATASGDWPAGREGWTVVVFGYDSKERATQAAADVQEDGFTDGGVLLSSDFKSLCPGIYVVFSGVFDGESQAKARLDALSAKDYAGMYVREISATKSPPGPCNPARPQT